MVAISQSLGKDMSANSLDLDKFDYIERVE